MSRPASPSTHAFLQFARSLYKGSRLEAVIPHRFKTAARAAWVAAAKLVGYPVSSPQRPRPPLLPDRRRMWLTTVVMACDLNREYLDFWPLTRRAWREIVGLEPLLLLIADEVPPDLRDDPAVVPFTPIPELHSVFQAQCIRLLYPALIETDGAVVISDIDLFPLRASYYLDPVALLDERFFVSYRDVRLDRGEIPIAFNAARPETWSEIFGVRTLDDVRETLADWGNGLEYDGRRAWPGWYRDQQILYEALTSWRDGPQRHWTLDDQYCGFNRLDRIELEREHGLEDRRRRALAQMKYSDYNCLFPFAEYADVSEEVLELALAAARGAEDRRRG